MNRNRTIYPYVLVARNVRIKLALRVQGEIKTYVDTDYMLTVIINNFNIEYKYNLKQYDIKTVSSDEIAETIYKDYRKFILKKFFTFY